MRRCFVRSEFFNTDAIDFDGRFEEETCGKAFFVLMNIKKTVKMCYDKRAIAFVTGNTVPIPVCIGKYFMEGQSQLLLS